MLALAVVCGGRGSAVFLKDHDPNRDVIAERTENSVFYDPSADQIAMPQALQV